MSAVAVVFWVSAGLLFYAQLGYPLLVVAVSRIVRPRRSAPGAAATAQPRLVSVIVPDHDESAVVAAKIANARALAWPRA